MPFNPNEANGYLNHEIIMPPAIFRRWNVAVDAKVAGDFSSLTFFLRLQKRRIDA
jgi:hypothetical protein